MSNMRVENYLVAISVPMRHMINQVSYMDIWEAEEYFIKLRDSKAGSHDEEVELDQARALMKFASSVGADLYVMECRKKKLKICFVFKSRADQDYFLKHFRECVEGATMR